MSPPTLNEANQTRSQARFLQKSLNEIVPEEDLDEIIAEIPENGRFLDAGCGTGNFFKQLIERARSEEVRRSDIEFVAFDYSEEAIEEAGKLFAEDDENKPIFGDLKDSEQMQRLGEFDYIFSRNVLFFFDDEEREIAFNNLQELCKDGGVLDIIIREKKSEEQQETAQASESNKNDFSKEDLQTILDKKGFETTFLEVTGRQIKYGDNPQPYNELRATSRFNLTIITNCFK